MTANALLGDGLTSRNHRSEDASKRRPGKAKHAHVFTSAIAVIYRVSYDTPPPVTWVRRVLRLRPPYACCTAVANFLNRNKLFQSCNHDL